MPWSLRSALAARCAAVMAPTDVPVNTSKGVRSGVRLVPRRSKTPASTPRFVSAARAAAGEDERDVGSPWQRKIHERQTARDAFRPFWCGARCKVRRSMATYVKLTPKKYGHTTRPSTPFQNASFK
jgi:hypothetical protein